MRRATKSPLVTRTPTPTQAQRIAARKALIAMSRRRQRPGSGSILGELLKGRGETMDWWRTVADQLLEGGVQSAVAGAIAAHAYMPPRQTGDFDLMVEIHKRALANNRAAPLPAE